MIDLFPLFKKTAEYRAIVSDKKKGALSHAYLTITSDDRFLDDYLRIIAKTIVCENGDPCNKCRKCVLIDKNAYSDVKFYPKDASVKTEDVTEIIEESYIKPIESDKKVFIVSHAETMLEAAQNKLLKTLEEPPQNVHIIIGATSEFSLLPTVKSRAKKFVIPTFSGEDLFGALVGECEDEEKLKVAISACDGTVGGAYSLYFDENLKNIIRVVGRVITEMQSSGEVLKFSNEVLSLGVDLKEFLSVLLSALRELLFLGEGKDTGVGELKDAVKNAKGFTRGAIVNAIEKTNEALARKKYNGNDQMIVEWLLFNILEGKYKWRK